jgi:DNA-binding MarR family transcriptional regulator
MINRSKVLNELIEPTLYAVRQGRFDEVQTVHQRARDALRAAKQALLDNDEQVHASSFELGVASALTEMLATAQQRTLFNDAIRSVRSVTGGVQTLHEIALVARSGNAISQKQLAERVGMDAGNFNRRIKSLEELGVVVPKRDGRSLTYEVTALGTDVLNELVPGWRAVHPINHSRFASEEDAAAAANTLAAGAFSVTSAKLRMAMDTPENAGARLTKFPSRQHTDVHTSQQAASINPRFTLNAAFDLPISCTG